MLVGPTNHEAPVAQLRELTADAPIALRAEQTAKEAELTTESVSVRSRHPIIVPGLYH